MPRQSPPATTGAPAGRRRWLPVAIAVAVFGVLVLTSAVGLNIVDRGDLFGALGTASAAQQYFAVFFFVLADAIVPIFPGETTLNAASTLAAQGELEIGLVMLAGALGAVIGDSCLYWIARRSSGRVEGRLEKAKQNAKVATGLKILEGRGGPVLLVLGRYVPGLRFVVNATMGLAGYPYPRFLLWSAIGGISWSIYTCALAYWLGSALADYPIASIVISGFVTTAILGAAYIVYRRRSSQAAALGDG